MTAKIPQAIFKQAKKNGVLNLNNRTLQFVPADVWMVNQAPSKDKNGSSFEGDDRWWDQVELTRLNLSSNEIETIPEDLQNFPCLVSLDIHDNKLKSLPLALSKLENLKRLDLSHNCLTSVPSLESAKGLAVLLLQYNKLSQFPSFGTMEACESLDISHNLLSDLPSTISTMERLRSFNASYNQLATLPEFSSACGLTMLNLDNNKLKLLPEGIGKLLHLQQLHVRNNLLESLPMLQTCKNLKEIYAGNNALKAIPENLPDCIMVLELRDNKIDNVSIEITQISNLERLDIANNNISRLPPEIGNMSNIKSLALDGNPLRSIRRDVISQGTQAILKHLKSRIVVSEGTTQHKSQNSALPQSEVHSEIARKHAISTKCKVNFSKADSTTVEQGLDDATGVALIDINASHCSLSSMPSKIFLFGNSLTDLNVSSNKLTSVPSSIVTLKLLTLFNVSNNCLSTLPDELGNLHLLREINFSNNRFTELPSCLYDLVNLEHLLADSNKVSVLDAARLKKLPKLSTLSLMNNNIGQVPAELALIESLQSLKLEGNVFRVPRQSIIQKGSAAVIEYLRSRIPQ